MKIARTLINGKPEFIASIDNGASFHPLKGDRLDEMEPDSEVLHHTPPLLAPIAPPQVFAIGLNYRAHAEEFNNPIPEFPVVFLKSITSVIGPDAAVQIPTVAQASFVDYEVELAIVIGKTTKNVSVDKALDHVLGYTIANDVTSRDWQKGSKGGGQWCRAKSFDTFCPLGPWIVTTDELPNPNCLSLQSRINGELRQSSSTADMIFPVEELIAFLSSSLTLLPGAVILTGTPSGVGAGLEPKKRLAVGDVMELEIESIGTLRNPVDMEDSGSTR